MKVEFIYWILLAIMGLYLMGAAVYKPVKYLLRLGFYFVWGGFLLLTVNLVFSHFGIQLAVNPVTILAAGILQLPGIVLLIMLNYLCL